MYCTENSGVMLRLTRLPDLNSILKYQEILANVLQFNFQLPLENISM